MLEQGPNGINRETPTWKRSLSGALGSAATTFVAMEAGALIAQYISGETPNPNQAVHFASGFGALVLAGRGAILGVLDNEQTSLPIRLVRSIEMGALSAGLATGLFIGIDKLSGASVPLIFTTVFSSWFASKGLAEGWYNMAGGRGIGFNVFNGRSIIPFRA